ncbi:MAG: M48 family metalloprotease [Chloroflexota bacterium]
MQAADAGSTSESFPVLDPLRQEQARAYARQRRKLRGLETAAGFLYFLVWMGGGLSLSVRRAAESLLESLPGPGSDAWWAAVLVMAVILTVPWLILTFPLDLYAGYVLPHRFKQSTQALSDWIADHSKVLAISAALAAPLLVGLYGLIRSFPSRWWLFAAVGYTGVNIVLAALSPVVLMPLFYKSEPLEVNHSDLSARLMALAGRARAHVAGVYRFDMSRRTRAANALLVGIGRTRRILLADTLLEEFTPDEIETILAHELAHQKHRDIPVSIALQALLAVALFFIVDIGLGASLKTFSLAGKADPAGLPLMALLFGGSGMLVLPFFAAFSRRREARADDLALRLTGKPQAFASALIRLANLNLVEIEPRGLFGRLAQTHPSLRGRIEKATRAASALPSPG